MLRVCISYSICHPLSTHVAHRVIQIVHPCFSHCDTNGEILSFPLCVENAAVGRPHAVYGLQRHNSIKPNPTPKPK